MTGVQAGFFADPGRAGKTLAALEAMFIASGSSHPPERFSAALHERLLRSPDPDMALGHLLRFIEAVPTPASLLNDLLQCPPLFDVVMTVFGFSGYFADILVRDPGLFRWLTASDTLLRPPTRQDLLREVDRALGMFRTPAKKLDVLKRLHRREVLRIGTRDILGEAHLASATAELSLLADLLVQACVTIAVEQLSPRFPKPPATPVAVIALGKLGGGELNYSSDIDLMVVYGDEGECRDSRRKMTSHQEYFGRLVEHAVQNMTQVSSEGHLYRVDLRLRPEGNAGPLARSLAASLLYYEARGELWERQMLIKARPVAGDLEFGALFLRRLEPFVYPRTLLHSPAESISRIKARIEASVQGEENVKLSPGGIRDIEFTVQTLQLLNGGRLPAVRSQTTLTAISLLESANLLTSGEARTLREGYLFLRTLEHRLQIMQNVQTHTLPATTGERAALARRVGLRTAVEMMEEYGRHTTGVRRVFDQVLSSSSSQGDPTLAAVLEGNVREESMQRFLAGYGFRNPHASSRAIAALLRGESLTGASTLDVRTREGVRRHAGELLKAVAGTPGPDLTLANLVQLAETPALRDLLYRELDDPAFRNLIVTLCARGPRFTRAIAARPSLLDVVIASRGEFTVPAPDSEEDVLFLKAAQEVRAGARHTLGLTTFEVFTGELTATADALLGLVYDRQVKKMRLKNPPLAVCALGKYGTGEITLDADLDLLFIAEARGTREAAMLENLAAGIVGVLSAVSGAGRGYEIDTRLRPEGRNAPLVVEKESYLKYLQHRASLWERQSLTRFRFVCGNVAMRDRVMRSVMDLVYGSPLPGNWVGSIVDMRKKMETRSRVRSGRLLDIKLGQGGMVDVEFLVQMLMLAAGSQAEPFHAQPTVVVLERLPGKELSAQHRTELVRIYRFYRSIETVMRVVFEQPGSVLPEGEKLEVVSRFVDGSIGPEFAARCSFVMNSVRQTFLETARRLTGA